MRGIEAAKLKPLPILPKFLYKRQTGSLSWLLTPPGTAGCTIPFAFSCIAG
jgi:hypothetical protein